VYDPERIKAALRGDQGRSGQGGRRTAGPRASAPAQGSAGSTSLDISDRGPAGPDTGPGPDTGAGWGASSSWDTAADLTFTSANGNHPALQRGRRPFDDAITEMADRAERRETAQADTFSWLSPSKPTSRPADSGTDFWATPVTAASVGVQLPAALPARAEEPTIRQASWPAPAETTRTQDTPATIQLPQRAVPDLVPGTGSAAAVPGTGSAAAVPGTGSAAAPQPGISAESAGSGQARATVLEPDYDRQDRFFPVRLLAVIIIAALIGSGLVLLLK
jgi:hypothetical protein